MAANDGFTEYTTYTGETIEMILVDVYVSICSYLFINLFTNLVYVF